MKKNFLGKAKSRRICYMKEEKISVEQETVRNCPILYRMKDRPMSETCMCWGWEFNHGWDNTVQRASYQLETLNNIFYPMYRIRVQADQIKEKFGTLCFYYSICHDHGPFLTYVIHKFQNIVDRLSEVDFGYKTVEDQAPYDYDEKKVLSKEQYDKETSGIKCTNVEYKKISEDQYERITHLHNYGRHHQEPTKKVFLWKLMTSLRSLMWRINSIEVDHSPRSTVATSYLDSQVERIIHEAEHECEERCEICGHQIGTPWSPSCQTVGYITYICDDCAEKLDKDYIKNDELWHGDKIVMTKNQMKIQRTMYELQYCTDDVVYLKFDNGPTGCRVERPKDRKTILDKATKDSNSPSESASVDAEYGSHIVRLTFTHHKDLGIYTCTLAQLSDDGNSVVEQRELETVEMWEE